MIRRCCLSLPYDEAINRIRAEYAEMPGMRLTREQVQRLSGVDGAVCRLVLQDLVQAKFLDVDPGGSYARRTDTASSRSRMETAALDVP